MSRQAGTTIRVNVIAIDPPFQAGHQVLFGLQDKRGTVEAAPATATTTFTTEIEVVTDGKATANVDVRGDHVHGRKGDRFLYLSWGAADPAEPFVMFARAKIKLADIPTELLATAGDQTRIECRVQATNSKGQPASGTVKHPDVSWHRPDELDATDD